MKKQEPYFVATESINPEFQSVEAERRKRIYPDENVIIARRLKYFDKSSLIVDEKLSKKEGYISGY